MPSLSYNFRLFPRFLPRVVLLLCAFGSPAFGQRNLTDIPVPDPEEERKTLEVADGFEINLFAADPLLAKPIQMNFDAQGRLWIASSEIYPQVKPGEKANDKIIVLTDANGDGRADKTEVFADGLLIPTGVEPGDGGAYVANSTELVHFKDTDGDGRADQRRVVLSGFGTEDTHHILHTLRWGHEGLLYFNQSIYIHSHIETPYGVRRLESGGIWHFRPKTSQLEVFARGFVNTWGHQQDYWGQSFATDGAYGEGINYVFPEATFFTYKGAKRIMKGLNPGSPKHCGLEIVSGRHLPDDWQGQMITCDFRAHRVCRFQVTDDGNGYTSREQPELVKSRHVAFRPIDVKMGPDGAIYIADWYNPIIQHGEVDFRDPRRDHTHGRIWRVSHKSRPLVERPKLFGATTEELLDQLKSPEGYTRHFAKRILSERDPKVVTDAAWKWLGNQIHKQRDHQVADHEHRKLEILWLFQTMDVADANLLEYVLKSPDPHVRAAATRVLYHSYPRMPQGARLPWLAKLIRDDAPRVRLEAVCALNNVGTSEAIALALDAIERPIDTNLDFALWQMLNQRVNVWLPEVAAGTSPHWSSPGKLEYALLAVNSPAVVDPLLRLLAKDSISRDRRPAALTLIGEVGNPEQLKGIFQQALDRDLDPELRLSLLAALTKAFRTRGTKPAGDLNGLTSLFKDMSESTRVDSYRLAGLYRMEAHRGMIERAARDPGETLPVREAAIEALASLGGPQSAAVFSELTNFPQGSSLTTQSIFTIQRAALVAWAGIDSKAANKRAFEVLADTNPADVDTAPLWTALLARKQGAGEMFAALGDRKLPPDIAKIGVRTARAAVGEDAPLVKALRSAGGLGGEPRKFTAAEITQLAIAAKERGDYKFGEMVYRRKELNCQKCHAIGGAGGVVGPDLISIGASAQPDYLVESLVDPNAKIKENYHSVIVETSDGRVITGIKVNQTDTELVLRDVEDRLTKIPLRSIEQQANGKSLMPYGLVEALTEGELRDLVRFLSELGKVGGPLVVGKEQVARRWLVLENTPEARQALNRSSFGAAAQNSPLFKWSVAYSQVSGGLPIDELPTLRPHSNNPETAFVRCEVDVRTAGRFTLAIDRTNSLSLWVDGQPMNVAADAPIFFAVGRHTLTFAIDADKRDAPLRVELRESPNSIGRGAWVTGP